MMLVVKHHINIMNERRISMASCKRTSKSVASKASSLMKDGRTSSKTKSVAASALSQRQKAHKGK